MKRKYKIPVSWQMYGHVEIEAKNWDDALHIADYHDLHEIPLPEDGEYVMSSFEVDHDVLEFEREEERQQIRRKVDGRDKPHPQGYPTGNDVDFGTGME